MTKSKEYIPGTIFKNKYQSFVLLWEEEGVKYESRNGILRKVACQCIDCGEMSNFIYNEVSRGKSVCNSEQCKPKRLLKKVKISVRKMNPGDTFKTRRDKIFKLIKKIGDGKYLVECENNHPIETYHNSIADGTIVCKKCEGKMKSNTDEKKLMIYQINKIFNFMKTMKKYGVLTDYLMIKYNITRDELNEKDLIYEQ